MKFLKQNLLKLSIILMFFVVPYHTDAHPGRTASDGCHYCRTNCNSWGEAWNERHCHNAKPIYNYSTPRPTLRPTPTPNQETGVLNEVSGAKTSYYRNPHWFREKLIQDLISEFGAQYKDIISRLVYTLLLDVKN